MNVLSLSQIEQQISMAEIKFHNNPLINGDILYFIYCYKNRNFQRILILMEHLINKTKALYLDEMYVTLLNYIDAIIKIKNFRSKYNKKHKSELVRVNTKTLNLTEFSNNSLEILINNSIYTFDIKNIIKLYKFSLINVDSHYYLRQKLEPIKNPYTNVEFSIREHLIFYEGIKKFYIKIGKFLPNYLADFKICYFDINIYERFRSDILFFNSVNSYLINSEKKYFRYEFDNMIHGSQLLEKFHCKFCFKRINIRLHFLHAIKLYILNSNSIYCFGLFENEYTRVCNYLNIKMENNHKKSHRRIRRVRVRGRDRVRPINISTHPFAI